MPDIETWDLILTEAGLEAALAAQTGGFSVDITHMAAGDQSYDVVLNPTGRTSQTALQNERERVEIAEAIERGNGQTSIAAVFDGPAAFYVREIGLFLEDGTLYAIGAKNGVSLFWKSDISTGYLTTELVLGATDPDNVRVVVGGAPIQLVTADIRADLSGAHEIGGEFGFALTRNIKEHMYSSMENFELMAQVRRGYGQSGIRMGRHYRHGGDAPYHRPSVCSFAAFGVHDHPNYPLMAGMPEITAIVNGYEVNTRHIDYRIVHSVGGGAYLEVEDAIPPATPPSVLAQPTPEAQVVEMREYLRAFSHKDAGIRDFAPYFDTYLSAVEVWLEVLDGDNLADTFPSFRHQLANTAHKAMNDDYMAILASGLKSRFENDDFKPTVIRMMRPDGSPQFAVLRYRVSAVRLGTYEQYPVHEMVSRVDDPVTRVGRGYDSSADLEASRMGRFRVNYGRGDADLKWRNAPGLLDEMMRKLPGLEGMGTRVEESYVDTTESYQPFDQRMMDFQTNDVMNSAYYNRFYSFELPGAAGRRDYRFGYNDPNLFRAATTRQEVAEIAGMGGGHRLSWAIPLELIVATPLGAWNPRGVTIGNSPAGNGKTAETAYSLASVNGSYYLTPAELFDGSSSNIDPADTNSAAWMVGSDGQPHLMRGSGIYIHMPRVANAPEARLRYPIAPVHHEGSFEFAHAEAVRQEQRGVLAALTDYVTEMKHTALKGGNNVA